MALQSAGTTGGSAGSPRPVLPFVAPGTDGDAGDLARGLADGTGEAFALQDDVIGRIAATVADSRRPAPAARIVSAAASPAASRNVQCRE